MPDNVEQIVDQDLELNAPGNESIDENANADSLRPGGGTAGAGDTKSQKIASIVTGLTTLSDDDLNGFHKMIAQIGKEADGVGDVAGKNKSSIAAKPSNASADAKKVIKEDLSKLFEGEEGISESFIDQASTLFEAAVTTRVALEQTRIEEEYETRLEESTTSMVAEFAERMDSYTDYLAEKFMEDNKLAIEAGLRAELSESLLAGIAAVFSEHYVSIPEDKVDIVEALTAELEETRNQLNEQINENIELTGANERAEIDAIVSEATEGLTTADADRLEALVEDLEYNSLEDFRGKIGLLKERFIEGNTSGSTGLVIEEVGIIDEDEGSSEETTITDPRMAAYVRQIAADATR